MVLIECQERLEPETDYFARSARIIPIMAPAIDIHKPTGVYQESDFGVNVLSIIAPLD